MGFRLEIDGAGPVKLTERAITRVEFDSEIPQDSNARATDNGAALKIWGKLLFSLGGGKAVRDRMGEPHTLERTSALGSFCSSTAAVRVSSLRAAMCKAGRRTLPFVP